MTIYLTGSDNRQQLLDAQSQLQALGHRVTTPYDVVDADWTEDANLLVRLQSVLGCELVATTNPGLGNWGPGADREVKVAHAANLPVKPVQILLATANTVPFNG